jgi:hypothetical protein
MASLVLSGDTSGSITVSAPAVAGSTTQTLVNVTGTLAPIVSGTAQTAPFTDNTRAEFTSIPSWVKRITVIFNAVSTNGTSLKLVQIGSGSFATTNYVSNSSITQGTSVSTATASTAGFLINSTLSADVLYGMLTLTNISGNIWVSNHTIFSDSTSDYIIYGGGSSLTAISGTLDRVRVITVNGTDTFDTGSIINILYE